MYKLEGGEKSVEIYGNYPRVLVDINHFFEKVFLVLIAAFFLLDFAMVENLLAFSAMAVSVFMLYGSLILLIVIISGNLGVKISDSNLCVSWLGKKLCVKDILSIKLQAPEKSNVPLIKMGLRSLVATIVMYAIAIMATIHMVGEIGSLEFLLLIITLVVAMVSAVLPARIGRKALTVSGYAVVGAIAGIVFPVFGSVLLSMLIFIAIGCVFGFLYAEQMKPKILTMIVEARIGGKKKTITLSGEAGDIMLLRNDLSQIARSAEIVDDL